MRVWYPYSTRRRFTAESSRLFMLSPHRIPTGNGNSPVTRRDSSRQIWGHVSARCNKRTFCCALKMASVILCFLTYIGGLRLSGQATLEAAEDGSDGRPVFTDVSRSWGVEFQTRVKTLVAKILAGNDGGGGCSVRLRQRRLPRLVLRKRRRAGRPHAGRGRAGQIATPLLESPLPEQREGQLSRCHRGRGGRAGHSYGMGVAVGDYDNDGDADLYVTNFGSNILYRNDGDGTFSDVPHLPGWGP